MRDKQIKVIDVRTPIEFAEGHVEGSLNIPLDMIDQKTNEILKINNPIILCCASGMRSYSAYQYLTQKGCTNVTDGGSWYNVANAMNEIK